MWSRSSSPAGTTAFTSVFTDDRHNPNLLAPGAVLFHDLNGDGDPEAIVVSSGSNSVLVYHNHGGKLDPAQELFRRHRSQSAVAVGDVNGDGVLDLAVANEGSNDVSILFGAIDAGGQWVVNTALQPRQSVGAGPNGVSLRNVVQQRRQGAAPRPGRDKLLDLVVTNGQDGTVSVLRGQGNGLFVPASSLSLGAAVLPGGADGLAVTTAGSVVGFDPNNLSAGQATLFAATAGREVNAVQAIDLGGRVSSAVHSEPRRLGVGPANQRRRDLPRGKFARQLAP